MSQLAVRELTVADIIPLLNYWYTATPEYLMSMGADINLLPKRKDFEASLKKQLETDYPYKQAYAIIWLMDGNAVGHCNVNKIDFGNEAHMHLHMWNPHSRKKGMGAELVKMSLPFFFKNLQLIKLICEPYSKNIAPNKTLAKAGFTFIKNYVTTPGALNFEQEVSRWEVLRL
jgi:RimJ/RimL family protein N-acetyltransferase